MKIGGGVFPCNVHKLCRNCPIVNKRLCYIMSIYRTAKYKTAKNIMVCRACNLISFSPCLTGPVDFLFAYHHKGPRFKSPGGYLCETGILLLVLSRYIGDPDVIDHFCGLV